MTTDLGNILTRRRKHVWATTGLCTLEDKDWFRDPKAMDEVLPLGYYVHNRTIFSLPEPS